VNFSVRAKEEEGKGREEGGELEVEGKREGGRELELTLGDVGVETTKSETGVGMYGLIL